MHLRLAIPVDLAAIRRLIHAAYQPYVARIGRAPGPMLDDYKARIEAGALRVHERDGQIAALVVMLMEPDAVLLDNIAVDPRWQGQGIGRAILTRVEAEARDGGHRAVRLYTNAVMIENIALYRRLGYRETGRRTEEGLHRVHMRKDL